MNTGSGVGHMNGGPGEADRGHPGFGWSIGGALVGAMFVLNAFALAMR
jgi:hypothetical protein